MKATGRGIAVSAALGLAACAATGTRVTTSSDGYRTMANSQQWWCTGSATKDTCGCAMDGQRVTCSLAQACLSSGSCTRAQ